MTLATFFPLHTMTLLGDVPVTSPVPAGAGFVLSTLPPWLAYLLPALGLFLLSTCVAALNEVIRQRDADGIPVSPRLRMVAAVLNVISANHDKARQQAAAAKEVKS